MDDQLLSCRCLYLGCKAGRTFGAIRQLLFIIVSLWTNPDWLSSSSSVRWWRWMLWAAGLSQLFMAALFSRSQRSSPSCHKRKNKPSLSPTLFLPPSIESRWLMCELRWGGGRQVTLTTWPLICRSIMSCNGTAALHECTHYSCIVSALQWTLSAATHTHTHTVSLCRETGMPRCRRDPLYKFKSDCVQTSPSCWWGSLSLPSRWGLGLSHTTRTVWGIW